MARSGELPREDAVNVVLDRGGDVYVVTIAGVLAPGGVVRDDGTCDLDALQRVLADRVVALPRLTATIVDGPHGPRLADRGIRIAQHVRTVEPVGDVEALRKIATASAVQRLPEGRPPWELLLVPFATGGRVGWVFRIHHALADGTTAAALLDGLFDPDLGDETPPAPREAHADARRAAGRGGILGELFGRSAARLPRTALLGELGPRRARVVEVPLAELRVASRAAGGTLNDAALAALGAGARAAFTALGERVPGVLPVSVPVLLPTGRDRSNQVSAAVVRVPLGAVSIVERIRQVAARSRPAIALARSRPLPWFSRSLLGARVMSWYIARQRRIGALSTNVRGPARPRTLAGAPIETVWALPVLAGNVRVGLALVSYAGTVSVCVAWSAALGDAGERLAEGVGAAIEELLGVVRSGPAT